MLRRAGGILLALIMGTGVGAAALAAPAAAGGWAVTVIDPGVTIEAGKAHQVSFWVLQHGTHPFGWDGKAGIGTVGLTLADGRGTRVTFTGKELPEPAHYVTTVTVPHAGRWTVFGVQGIFAGFHVGALTVPGTFQPLGVTAAPSETDMQKYWPGKVRPPVLEEDQNRDAIVYDEDTEAKMIAKQARADAAPPAAGSGGGTDTGAGEQNAAAPAERPDPRLWILAGGLVVLLAALAVGGRRWWVRRGVPQT
jgi:hypothetical protein